MHSASTRPDSTPPLSPCTGVCTLDSAGLCIGCRRTLGEIAGWGTLSHAERCRWIDEVQPSRPRPAQP